MSSNHSVGEFKSLYDLMERLPDEDSCIEYLIEKRWSDGIVCQRCGVKGVFYRVKRDKTLKCKECRKTFSVRKNTIFEDSNVPLRKWFVATWLLLSHRKGIPSTELARELGVTQKTAWFMLCRLRKLIEPMRERNVEGVIEVDETYVGGRERNKHADKKLHRGPGVGGKTPVMGALKRDGNVVTRVIPHANALHMEGFVYSTVEQGSTVYTDEHRGYMHLSGYRRGSTTHGRGHYVEGGIHTNGIESFWAGLKRSFVGVYHHWSKKHFDLYLGEFEIRWNLRDEPEGQRLAIVLAGVNGTRLTYQRLIQ